MSQRKEPLQGITKNAILRLARRAGVFRTSSQVFETIRGHIEEFLRGVLHKASNLKNFDLNSKTISTNNIQMALPTTMYSADISDKKCQPRKAKHSSAAKDIKNYSECPDLLCPDLVSPDL